MTIHHQTSSSSTSNLSTRSSPPSSSTTTTNNNNNSNNNSNHHHHNIHPLLSRSSTSPSTATDQSTKSPTGSFSTRFRSSEINSSPTPATTTPRLLLSNPISLNQNSIHPLDSSIDTTTCLVSSSTYNQISPSTSPTKNHHHQDHHHQSINLTIATDALLFQNLRGHAQELGLESDSLGWAIIQAIHNGQPVGKSGTGTLASLIERLQSLAHSFETLLLLPKSKLSTHTLNQETIFDHILLLTPSQKNDRQSTERYLLNLNGWKGLIEGDRIVFTSPGKPLDLNLINDLDSRFILSKVQPATCLSNELTSPTQLRFPIYSLISPALKTITIPRLSSNGSVRGNTAKRLASLFTSKSESEPVTVSIRVIDRGLDSYELDQSINRAVTNRITDGLGSLEENMLSIIQKFITRFSIGKLPSSSSFGLQPLGGADSLYLASNEEISNAIQDMYDEIDAELEKEYQKESAAMETEAETRMIIDHTLELIEEIVCVELYDRLFEECVEDQTLTEKIARLNLLDMTLDHLGLDLERREMDDPDGIITIRAGLDDIIHAASAELNRFQDHGCRAPRDKVGVYVTVHKLIVDGLSSLPPIPMKKEGIPTSVTAIKLSQGEIDSHEVEMSHTLDRTEIQTDSTTMDRTLPMSAPLRQMKNDQPSASDLMDAIHTNLIDPPARSRTNSPDPKAAAPPDLLKTNVQRPNSSSADLILPILIYLIIKTNPQNLLSNLKYVNRFRYHRLVKGETEYCLVNFSVCCEFIKNLVHFDGSQANQALSSQIGRPEDNEESGSPHTKRVNKNGYGTFPLPSRHNREKTGGSEVEEALIAASRAVGGVLMGGYQRVISSSLLDAPVTRLGLASGVRSSPRTLEDVKKLIGSSSGARREGNMSSWSNRVGLLRRNPTHDRLESQPEAAVDQGSNSSNAVKRLSSLFQNATNSPSLTENNLGPLGLPPQADDERVSFSQRLSSLPGLGRLGHKPARSREVADFEGLQTDEGLQNGDLERPAASLGTARSALPQQGPIVRLESCKTSDELVVGDIPLLLADYQRLARIGREAGLW